MFATLMCSIWINRNKKVWENSVETPNQICDRACHVLEDWNMVQMHNNRSQTANGSEQQVVWLRRRCKCNIDASFSSTQNRVGIGMRIRDAGGNFVLAKLTGSHQYVQLKKAKR
jgi:hypothetical protein